MVLVLDNHSIALLSGVVVILLGVVSCLQYHKRKPNPNDKWKLKICTQ